MRYLRILPIFALFLLLAACGLAGTPAPSSPVSPLPTPTGAAVRTLTVMTHDAFDASQSVLAAFEASCNCKLEILKSGDAGLMLNQALLTKNNPLADAMYGVDNTFLSRALDGGILEPYQSPVLADVPDQFKLDPTFQESPVDYGDVCLNYDIGWFQRHSIAPPADLPDLVQPAYKGLTVVENPATSSPGLCFLLATLGRYGETGSYTWLNYWEGLRANDVLVAQSWNEAYYSDFTYTSSGDRPIVVSYASSPPAEVVAATQPITQAPTASIVADNSCFRQIEFVGILKGTKNRDLAEKWVDFMLSPTFQDDMPLHMYVFPVNTKATLPDVFVKYTQIPAKPVLVSPAAIEANRDKWIQQWTQTVVR